MPHGTLYGRAQMGAARATRAVAILNEQLRSQGVTHCPADFVTIDLVIFTYMDRSPLTVAASASGCPHFTNGTYETGDFSPAFVRWTEFRDALVPLELPSSRT